MAKKARRQQEPDPVKRPGELAHGVQRKHAMQKLSEQGHPKRKEENQPTEEESQPVLTPESLLEDEPQPDTDQEEQ